MCIKIKTKIHHKKHKKDGIGLIQKPRGHKEDGASFPNRIQYKVSQIHNQILLQREERGERHRGGGLEKQRSPRTDYKSRHNLIQVKGYLYPRRPVRPVPWTGQTGARDRSDRLACSTPCTQSHPTAQVLSSK